MKIKKICIEDFGALRGKTFTFEDSFTFFSKKNEFGKSTVIEAIKAGLFGFSSIKNYPFLPLSGAELHFDCLIDLEGPYKVNPFYISRKNTGERAVSKILEEGEDGFEGSKSSKNLKNASIFQGLKDLYNVDIKEIPSDFWVIDSNSIEEHKLFLRNVKKSGIDLYESIHYKGRLPEEILKELEEKKKALYTNNKNSNSKIMENKRKIREIQDLMLEMNAFEREKEQEYNDYLEKGEEILFLKNRVKWFKNKIEALKRDEYKYKLVLECRELEKNYAFNGFQNLEKTPDLSTYRSEKVLLNEFKKKMEKVKRHLDVERNKKFDETIVKLVSLQRSKEMRALINVLSDMDEKVKLIEKKRGPIQSLLSGDFELDLFLAEKELSKYQLQYAKLERVRELKQGSFAKKDVLVSAFLLFGAGALTLFKPILALLPLLVCLGFLFFKFFQSTSKDDVVMDVRDFNLDEYEEIRKVERANKLISNLNEPREELVELIKQDLNEIEEYQNSKKEKRGLEERTKDLRENNPELFQLIDSSSHSIAKLRDLYESQWEDCSLAFKNIGELEEQLEEYNKQIRSQEESIERTRKIYEDLWGSGEESEIEDRLNKAREQKGILNQKRMEIASLKIDAESILSSKQDYEALLADLSADLDKDEEKLISLMQAFYKLEERLSKQYDKPGSDYSGLSLLDLNELKNELREKNRSLSIEYNMLHLLWKLIDRTFEILKTKLKPSYVNRAGEYFSILAPDSGIAIEYSTSSEIIFKDKDSSELLSFDRLSTGTQAQVVLSLKIAYLEELDPESIYPLIIDDALMAYDNTRRDGTLNLLEKISKTRQVIYFQAA